MTAATTCICTLSVKDMLGAVVTNAELICTPRKSFIQAATSNLITGESVRAVPDIAGLITMTLARSATDNQKVVFTLNYNDGKQFDTIVFDPITIPASASVDLSTLLTVSRG